MVIRANESVNSSYLIAVLLQNRQMVLIPDEMYDYARSFELVIDRAKNPIDMKAHRVRVRSKNVPVRVELGIGQEAVISLPHGDVLLVRSDGSVVNSVDAINKANQLRG